ncbi:uncharacterized protein LOC108112381 [Drosophila eugracilis]|uniref:uncharacterized protein LOC108112381 n=1 Tax=Drosophila eugracilis TaxID=29029 RepID=UPI0007E5DB60|nr:uncharacterized protein LOC108112381 [Drosophila eugracilis]
MYKCTNIATMSCHMLIVTSLYWLYKHKARHDRTQFNMFSWSLLAGIWLGVLLSYGTARKWDYEPLSITTYSSDDELMKIDVKIERVSRGVYGVTGRIEWNYDTTDKTMVEGIVLRSSSGEESDYKLLPWAIPSQSLYDHMNTYYKEVSMKNFKHCSNVPQFEGQFQPPMPKMTYIGNKCVIDGDGLPDMIPQGYYKIILKCYGPEQPTWNATVIAKVTTRMF